MWFLRMEGNDPCRNLATEEYVFGMLAENEEALILWQNRPVVVVGKFQNTVEEINNDYVREHGIDVVRRLSGGGAVYHDLGNLNYTLIAPAAEAEEISFRHFCEPVLKTLSSFGAEGSFSGRNDLLLDGKKFSGNARYIRKGKVMHHGTILFDSDLEVIGKALRADRDKISSKGIKSVRSRVTNLRPYLGEDVTLPVFEERLKEILGNSRTMRDMILTPGDRAEIESLRVSRYAAWEWNYGFSPAFSMRKKTYFPGCGLVEASLSADAGRVGDIRIRGDFFSTGEIGDLEKALCGTRLVREDIERAIGEVSDIVRIENLSAGELAALIVP